MARSASGLVRFVSSPCPGDAVARSLGTASETACSSGVSPPSSGSSACGGNAWRLLRNFKAMYWLLPQRLGFIATVLVAGRNESLKKMCWSQNVGSVWKFLSFWNKKKKKITLLENGGDSSPLNTAIPRRLLRNHGSSSCLSSEWNHFWSKNIAGSSYHARSLV